MFTHFTFKAQIREMKMAFQHLKIPASADPILHRMRDGEWKLVRPYVTRNLPEGESDQKPVLYNLKENPYETEDVSKNHPDIYNKMNVLPEEWSRQVEYGRVSPPKE